MIPYFVREFVQNNYVTILAYHDIAVDKAESHFKILHSKYSIISLKDCLSSIKSGRITSLSPKPLVITFDDGDKSNSCLLSLLQKYEICPTIFLCSGIVCTSRHFWWKHIPDILIRRRMKEMSDEKRLRELKKYGFVEDQQYCDTHALSRSEINTMRGYVDFQSHTEFHPILTKCSDEKVEQEIRGSKEELQNELSLKIYALAYPNGNYSEREICTAINAGYECAVTLDHGFNSRNTSLFRLKRIVIPDDCDEGELLVRVSGVWGLLKKLFSILSHRF